jgi:PhnB protein
MALVAPRKPFQPEDRPKVIPRIITDDVGGMVEFLRSVFGALGQVRSGAPAEMKIGDSIVMASDGGGVRQVFPAFLYVYLESADAAYQRAIASGARSIEKPTETPYGDRRATVQDQWGNMWQIATYGRASA